MRTMTLKTAMIMTLLSAGVVAGAQVARFASGLEPGKAAGLVVAFSHDDLIIETPRQGRQSGL